MWHPVYRPACLVTSGHDPFIRSPTNGASAGLRHHQGERRLYEGGSSGSTYAGCVYMSAPRSMHRWLAAGIALATCVAEPSLAQLVLEGRVLDDATERPLVSARVLLLNRYRKVAGRTVTDEAGRFRFERSGSGQYRLDVKAVGYLPTVTPLMWMVESGFANLEVRLSPNAVLLAPLEIVALAPLSTSGVPDNVEHRRTRGFGYQLTREDIEERRPMRLSDLLVTLPGVRMGQGRRGSGARSISMGRALPGCQVQIFLDGMQVNRGGVGGGVLIDDLVSPLDVEVIEVFRGLGSIPPEFLTPEARCGVIAIWTRRSPP